MTQGLEYHCLHVGGREVSRHSEVANGRKRETARDLKGTHTRPLNMCMPREGGDGPRNPCHFLVEQRPGTLVEGRGGVAID